MYYQNAWKDQLTRIQYYINGSLNYYQTLTYDASGNIISLVDSRTSSANKNYQWDGRQLSYYSSYCNMLSFKYNDQGIRTRKSQGTCVGNVTTDYVLDGDKVLVESRSNGITLYFTYDVDGTLLSMNYNGNEYFYITNMQGDVIELVDINGNSVVKYKYDAWGNIISQTGGSLADINPYRYRGYRYDVETGLYYLQSRYYDPTIGRFISSDGLLGETGNLLTHNMYAYCANNPVMYIDPSGESFIFALGIGFLLGAIIGGGFETASQINDNGFTLEDWDWGQIGLSALGGGIAGMISAIPIGGTGVLSYLASFGIGGLASVSGGLISGSVSFSEPSTIILSFAIGGVANVLARGISSKINKMVADKAKNTLQNSFAFSNMKLSDMVGTGLSNNGLNPAYLKLANEAARLVTYSHGAFTKSIAYSSINSSLSSLFSGWY
jgi:RHS repeat-associated protein